MIGWPGAGGRLQQYWVSNTGCPGPSGGPWDRGARVSSALPSAPLRLCSSLSFLPIAASVALRSSRFPDFRFVKAVCARCDRCKGRTAPFAAKRCICRPMSSAQKRIAQSRAACSASEPILHSSAPSPTALRRRIARFDSRPQVPAGSSRGHGSRAHAGGNDCQSGAGDARRNRRGGSCSAVQTQASPARIQSGRDDRTQRPEAIVAPEEI